VIPSRRYASSFFYHLHLFFFIIARLCVPCLVFQRSQQQNEAPLSSGSVFFRPFSRRLPEHDLISRFLVLDLALLRFNWILVLVTVFWLFAGKKAHPPHPTPQTQNNQAQPILTPPAPTFSSPRPHTKPPPPPPTTPNQNPTGTKPPNPTNHPSNRQHPPQPLTHTYPCRAHPNSAFLLGS